MSRKITLNKRQLEELKEAILSIENARRFLSRAERGTPSAIMQRVDTDVGLIESAAFLRKLQGKLGVQITGVEDVRERPQRQSAEHNRFVNISSTFGGVWESRRSEQTDTVSWS